MNVVEIKKNVFWVGAVDWKLRSFHGYKTQRGSTYNAYLIMDEKIVLVDTVKHHLYEDMLARIKEVVDPSEIDIIVSNHVEMDHSGSLPMIKEVAPGARIVTSPMGKKGLERHYKEDWDLQVVKSGETMDIGERTLTFFHTPMVHWPDNMVTYVAEDKLLLSNDAFGQHIARSERFDDEIGWGILKEEAAKYYANIVLPYCDNVRKALDALSGLEVDMIAPSHGAIWREHIPEILEEYGKWATHETEVRALIVYDTMWGSTAKMGAALKEGLLDAGVSVRTRSLEHDHISDIMTDVLTHRMVLLGSPTLNNGMLPTMGEFLTYLKGLRPRERIGLAFGSYGWGGQAVGQMEDVMEELGWEMPVEGVKIKYIPDEEDLTGLRELGTRLGKDLNPG